MRWGLWIVLCGVGACWGPPSLPLIDDVPIESTVKTCADARYEWADCVLDGDTFTLVDCGQAGMSVRLLSLNAPEIAHDGAPAECYGEEARLELQYLIEGRRVLLEFDTPMDGRDDCLDAYERELAWVWLLDDEDADGNAAPGTLINEWLLEWGFARRDYDEFGQTLIYRRQVDAAEARAIDLERGLWGACEGEGG